MPVVMALILVRRRWTPARSRRRGGLFAFAAITDFARRPPRAPLEVTTTLGHVPRHDRGQAAGVGRADRAGRRRAGVGVDRVHHHRPRAGDHGPARRGRRRRRRSWRRRCWGKLKANVQFFAILLAIVRPDVVVGRGVGRRVGDGRRCGRHASARRSTTSARIRRRAPPRRAAEWTPGVFVTGGQRPRRRRTASTRASSSAARGASALARRDDAGRRSARPARAPSPRRPARRGRHRRGDARVRRRLPRRGRQHPVPDRPGRCSSASTSRAPRPVVRAARTRCRAARSHVVLLGDRRGEGHRRARGHRRTAVGTSRTTTARSTRASAPSSTIGAERGLDVVCVNPSSVQGPGRTAGTAKMLLALARRPAEGLRRHPHQRRRHRRLHARAPAGGRARRAAASATCCAARR